MISSCGCVVSVIVRKVLSGRFQTVCVGDLSIPRDLELGLKHAMGGDQGDPPFRVRDVTGI